jgi:hypothetical protein
MEPTREYTSKPYKPLPPIKLPREAPEGFAVPEKLTRAQRVLRRFVNRGGQLVEVEKVVRETR